jgi:Na+/H+ antiporter NhaD/arsenite permease-like protein
LNIHPPIAYLFVTLILAFMAASIKKSEIIDFIGEKFLKGTNEKTATMKLVALSHILAPFFLSFVLISCFENWILRFKEKEKTLTLLVASAIMGSIITPFGNLRNIFISIILGKGAPILGFSTFISIMLPLWIASLFILLAVTYFICEENVIKETSSAVEWKKPELIFSIILLFFVFGYFNAGKHYNLNLLGLIILGGVFCIAFMGTEPLKAVNWWLFIPVGVCFIVFYILYFSPITTIKLSPWIVYSVGSIGSAGFSSNLLSFILPLLNYDHSIILNSVAVGSLAGTLGSYETIWIWARGRTKINLSLMFKLFFILLSISLIILFLRR